MAFFICRILRKNTGKHLLHKCNFSKLLVGTTNLICRLTYRYAYRTKSLVNRKVRNGITRKEPWLFDMLGSAHVERMIMEVL